jgi:hypothetical protein
LAKGHYDEGHVQPNYNKEYSAGDAYFDFVKAFVAKHKSLDIICFVHIFNQNAITRSFVPELPFWVPDWTAQVTSFVVPVMASQSNNPIIGNFRPVDEMLNFNLSQAYTHRIREPGTRVSIPR